MWNEIAADAASESVLWADALLPDEDRRLEPVFSPLAPSELGLGLETIYEGYLVHYGRSRLFAPSAADTALLLGDYLYAYGLVRVAATGNVAAVLDLSELISMCAQVRAESRDGDGAAWAATAAHLGTGSRSLDAARDALRLDADPLPLDEAARESAVAELVERALAAHALLVG